MKKSPAKAKSLSELTREAEKLRIKLNELKTERFLKEMKNIRLIRTTRRQLAQKLTAINQAAQGADNG